MWTEARGQQKQSNDPGNIQHILNTPNTGLRERGNDTSKSTGRSSRQKAATRRNMRREERVTVQGPVKKQQSDGMSHRAGTASPKRLVACTVGCGGCPRLTSDARHGLWQVIFWTVQLLYTAGTFLPAKLSFDYHWANALMMWFALCVCVWNGANYYIEVSCAALWARVACNGGRGRGAGGGDTR